MNDDTPTRATNRITLPLGWAYVDFTATCFPESDKGLKIQQKVYERTGLYPIVDQGEQLISGYTNDEKILYRGSLPVIVFGDHTRRFKYIDRPFAIGADGVKLIKPSVAWHAKCLWYFLQSQKIENRGYSRHYQLLRQIKLLLPPLNEQKRIVEKLEEILSNLDTAIARLEYIKTNLKRYRASVLQAAVEGRLTAEWRKENPPSETGAELLARLLKERRAKWEENQLKKYAEQGKTPPKDWKEKYPEPVKPDTTGLPELPDGWVWATADQLSPNDISNGRSVPTANSGPRVLRLTAIKNGCIDLLEFKYGSWSQEEAAPYIINKGDLLIARGNGSLSLVGRMGLVKTVVEPTAFPDTMIRLKVLESVVNSRWIAKYWDTQHIRKHLEQRARTSAGIYKISQPDILSAPVAIPPNPEQDEIVLEVNKRISDADTAGRVIDSAIQRANQLRQSILKRAFEGRLVPQDPNDEPASVLLERIRAERAEQAATVKPPRARRKRKGDTK